MGGENGAPPRRVTGGTNSTADILRNRAISNRHTAHDREAARSKVGRIARDSTGVDRRTIVGSGLHPRAAAGGLRKIAGDGGTGGGQVTGLAHVEAPSAARHRGIPRERTGDERHVRHTPEDSAAARARALT